MELILAKTAGFCFGVKRAVDCVYKEAAQGKIYTYGPIIHNKAVTEALENKGVEILHDFENVSDGRIILRSHGVAPEIYCVLARKGLGYTDCTCPYVKKIHHIVAAETEKGNQIIIIGNKKHPEVLGINGWARNNAIIFATLKEIDDFPFDLSYNYNAVVQTTFQRAYFDAMIERIEQKGVHLTVFNTICAATVQRQEEAEQLSKTVDKMIVIGDKTSSNSKELYEICIKNCKHTYFIETFIDLQLNIFSTNDKIGITAGASTPPATIKEALQLMSDLEKSSQSFEEMLNETFVTLHTGDVVKGTIIQVTNSEVSVNLGYKSDGIIQKSEFADDPDINLSDIAKIGDEIEVFVIRVNDGEGNVLLSKKRVDSQKGMEDIEAAVESGAVFQGKVIEVVKGGLIALINGIRAFVPSSQVSDRFVEDMNVFKGQELDFNILEVDKTKRRVIAGRKELAKKFVAEQKAKVFATIEAGQKITGTVSRIVDFGAFIDLGGVDGLVHISELSWGRVKKVTDVLKEGDTVNVTVLEVNKEKEKISLSLRDIDKDPWATASEKYAVGNIIGGKVVRILPFGAFVELEEGVDGLVHISQISTKRVEKPEDELSIGQIITVKVTEIDIEHKKISLSKKAAEAVEEKAAEIAEEKAAEVADEKAAEAAVEDTEASAEEPVVEETVVEEVTADTATVNEELNEESAVAEEAAADSAATEETVNQ